MKCSHRSRESKYSERKDAGLNARCAGCGKQFAFEPQRKDPFTDAAFKAAIESVSAKGQVRWGVEHLYYELCRRLLRRALPWSGCVVLIMVSAIPLAVLRLWVFIPILIPLWIGVWILLRRYGRSDTVPMDQTDFDRLWDRWVSVHGQPVGVIVRKAQPGVPRSRESDIGDYSFDRAVICDRARTVDLLIANNFHFENNCAVLSVGGYPEGPFEIVRTMLKRNPKLQVFALHDASVAGCQLARLLVNDSRWFKDQVPVTDVGLRPGHAEPFKGLFLPTHVAVTLPSGDGISASETAWLSKYALELAAIRPEQILKRLFRAINRREESNDTSTGGGGSDGGVYSDSSSFSSDAGDSAGGQTRSDSAVFTDIVRRRACGRIAGIVGLESPRATERFAQTKADGYRLLGPDSGACVVDFDACWLDGRALDVHDWRPLCREHRLGSISGAFAAAWREPDGTICLARDQIGERSLFYARVGRGLVFASDLRALLAGGLVEPVISRRAVARYLSYGYLPGKETLLSGVHKVHPGEMVRFRGGELSSTFLWSLPPEGEIAEPDEGELRRELRAELESAVRRRLPVSGPVGAFLSGGIDSSLVVALARRFHRDDVLTYSVSFGAGYRNELPFSSLVAEHCRTRHRVVEISPQAILQHLDGCLAMLGDPIGDPLTVPNALLFREAARDVDVVLNGEGGDPCFGGPKNLPMLLAELLGDGLESEDVASPTFGRERSYLRAHQKCYDDLPKMLLPDVMAGLGGSTLEQEIAPFFTDPRWTRFVARLMAINVSFKGPYHILHKVDAVSAPFGVVARSPLFDRAIVELAFAIPSQLKLRGSVEKYLLKEAVRDLLPGAIVDRPKSGMLVPVEAWFRGPLLSDARERLMDGLTRYGLFNRQYLEGLLDGRLAGLHPRRGIKIWMLVTLESWLRSVAARSVH